MYDEQWIETSDAEKNHAVDFKKKSFEEAEIFFNSMNLDFSNFKFNRDEANKR